MEEPLAPCSRKVLFLEKFIAGLLCVPHHKLLALYNVEASVNNTVHRAEVTIRLHAQKWIPGVVGLEGEELCVEAERLRNFRVTQELNPAWHSSQKARWHATVNQLSSDTAKVLRVVDAMRTLMKRKHMVKAMRVLLTEYAPACLHLGTMVRECHWVLRQRGTGAHAQKTLQTALLLLLQLLGDDAHKEEYVRSLCVALTLWRQWNSQIPGCCYSGEPNEAGLSRLGSASAKHPHATSTQDVNNLYILVNSAKMGVKDIRPSSITERWQQQVERHVDHFVRHKGMYAFWMPFVSGVGAQTTVEANLPGHYAFPGPLSAAPATSVVRDIFHYEVQCLVESRQLHTATVEAMDATYTKRTTADKNALDTQCADMLAWENSPQSLRSAKPPRKAKAAAAKPRAAT